MVIIVKVKDTDNIIGLKEDIAMRLEGVVDIERIDVLYEKEPIQDQFLADSQAIINSMKPLSRKEIHHARLENY